MTIRARIVPRLPARVIPHAPITAYVQSGALHIGEDYRPIITGEPSPGDLIGIQDPATGSWHSIALEDLIISNRNGVLATDVSGMTIPVLVIGFETVGYAASGDGGAALYKRAASEPAHPGKLQSADGAWWELAVQTVNPIMFGARNDGSVDATPLVQDAIDYVDFHGGGTVRVLAGRYLVDEITLPGNVVLDGDGPGGTTLVVSGGISMHTTKLRAVFTISNMNIEPSGAAVPFGVKTTYAGGLIPKVYIDNVDFKGPQSDIVNPGSATPNFYFNTYMDIANAAFMSLRSIRGWGPYQITWADAGQPAATFIKLSGPGGAARLVLDNVDANSFRRVVEIDNGAEGFFLNNSEWFSVRQGLVVTDPNMKPGGWINSLHINCSEVGLQLNNRNLFYVDGFSVLRQSNYQDAGDWTGIDVTNCNKIQFGLVNSRPDTTGLSGFSAAMRMTNCDTYSIAQLQAFGTSRALQGVNSINGTVLTVTAENCGGAVDWDATCSGNKVLAVTTKSTTTAWVDASSPPANVLGSPLRFRRVDTTATNISAAGSESITVGGSAQWVRRGFGAGAGTYTYTFNLSNTGAVAGDIVEFKIDLASANPTVVFNDGTGAAQLTLNTGSPTKRYSVRFCYSGQWRCIGAFESLA